jgi:hypothetical protein
MRCLSCNEILTDYEATRRSANTEEYIDLCNLCFRDVKDDLKTIDRTDLVSDDCLDLGALEESGLDIDLDDDL